MCRCACRVRGGAAYPGAGNRTRRLARSFRSGSQVDGGHRCRQHARGGHCTRDRREETLLELAPAWRPMLAQLTDSTTCLTARCLDGMSHGTTGLQAWEPCGSTMRVFCGR